MNMVAERLNIIKRVFKTHLFKGNLRTLSMVYLFSGIALTMLRVNLQPFFLSLGASMSLVGLLEAIGGYHGIAGTLAQPFSGWISDRKGRKIFLILGKLFSLNALILIILVGYFQHWILLALAMMFLGLSTGVSLPARDSTIVESVEADEISVAYSIFMLFTLIPGLFAVLGGFLADNFGYYFVFYICLFLQALSLIFIFLVKDTLHVRRVLKWSELADFAKSFMVPEKKLKKFYFIIALDGFSFGVGSAILSGLLTKTYGFSKFQLGIISVVSSFSAVCFQLPLGVLVKKMGCKILMAISEFAGVIMMVGWLTLTNFEAFAFLSILNGIVITAWVPAVRTLVASSVNENSMAEAMGKLAFFGGLASFIAPYIGGFLYDMFGFKVPILTGLIGVILVIVLILLWVPKHQFA